jgi:hypothetical protein
VKKRMVAKQMGKKTTQCVIMYREIHRLPGSDA